MADFYKQTNSSVNSSLPSNNNNIVTLYDDNSPDFETIIFAVFFSKNFF